MTGSPPEADLKDLENLLRVFEEKNRQAKIKAAENFSKQYGKAYNLDSAELLDVIIPGSKMPTTLSETDRPKMIRQNGVTFRLNEETGEYEEVKGQ